jgi:hypothetical protein
MKSDAHLSRSVLFGFVLFIAFTISRLVTDDAISFKTFLPGLAGGLVAGFIIYIGEKLFSKRKDRE